MMTYLPLEMTSPKLIYDAVMNCLFETITMVQCELLENIKFRKIWVSLIYPEDIPQSPRF